MSRLPMVAVKVYLAFPPAGMPSSMLPVVFEMELFSLMVTEVMSTSPVFSRS